MPVRPLLAILALLLASTLATAQDVETAPSVDLERYAGTWYEQARLPLFFQRNCIANTTANYSLRADGRIDVVNQCDKDNGERVESRAIARQVGDSTSKLEVRFAPRFLSFLPFVWGDYWIISLDPDYRWALVGSPDRKYLWILTREQSIPANQLETLIGMAQEQGYDTSEMIRTEQR